MDQVGWFHLPNIKSLCGVSLLGEETSASGARPKAFWCFLDFMWSLMPSSVGSNSGNQLVAATSWWFRKQLRLNQQFLGTHKWFHEVWPFRQWIRSIQSWPKSKGAQLGMLVSSIQTIFVMAVHVWSQIWPPVWSMFGSAYNSTLSPLYII